MTPQNFRKAVGIAFVAEPMMLTIPYAMLISSFGYPDILPLPAGQILTRCHEGEADLALTA